MTMQAVFFDLDGTLVDSNEHHVAAWAKVFTEAGHVVPRERIRSQIGKGGDNLVPALLPGLSEAAQKRLSGRHGEILTAEHIDQVRPFAAAHACWRGLRLRASASSSPPPLRTRISTIIAACSTLPG